MSQVHDTISEEERNYFSDAFSFLSRELDAGHVLAEILESDGEHAFAKKVRAAVLAAQAVMSRAAIDFNAALEANQIEDRYYFKQRLQDWLESMPKQLQAIAVAHSQRRRRNINHLFGGRIPRRRIHLSEVHLSHAQALLAAEKLSDWYHDRLLPFYGSVQVSSPILVISEGICATFQRPFGREIPLLADRGDYGVHLGYVMNFSHISLARWAPSQIRYYSTLAHEQFHRVLHFLMHIRLLLVDNDTKFSHDPADPALDLLVEQLSELLGEHALSLLLIQNDLQDLFTQYFQVAAASVFRTTDRNAKQYRSSAQVNQLAASHTEELLSDFAALVLSGPAYAFSSAPVLMANPVFEEERLQLALAGDEAAPRHPPSLARVRALQSWLKRPELGFRDTVDRIGRFYGESGMCCDIGSDLPCTRLYDTLLSSDELWDVLARLLKLLEQTSRGIGDHPGTVTCGPASGRDEKAWLDHWSGLISKVTRADVMPGQLRAYCPTDVVNAIWLRRAFKEFNVPGKHQLEWRLALCNCGEGGAA